MSDLAQKAAALKEKLSSPAPQHKSAIVDAAKTIAGGTPTAPAQVPFGTTGPIGRDSEGYSIAKAVAYSVGECAAENCKTELDVSQRLKSLYPGYPFHSGMAKSILIPFDTNALPITNDGQQNGVNSDRAKFVAELRQKMASWDVSNIDHDEIENYRKKTLSVGIATEVGNLRGFPTMGELVELQRNYEIVSRVGATQMSLGGNGLFSMPKLRGASTAYMVGELQTSTESQQTTGIVNLSAKKMVLRTRVSREAIKFVNPSVEAMIRNDMARVAAIKVDQQVFYGTGSSTEVNGLQNYATTAAWSEGNDDLLLYAPAGGTNGWTIQPEDLELMASKLPDAVEDEALKFVGTKGLYTALRNRRADAVSANDAKGAFLFDRSRSSTDSTMKGNLVGYDFIKSSTIAKNRTKGSGTGLTSLWLGYWNDLVIARFGVMEVQVNQFSDTDWTQDTLSLRAIQYLDAAPRHASSFVVFHDVLEA
jgi:HK97 family phage major capsid protein